jgi:hypothetical protein
MNNLNSIKSYFQNNYALLFSAIISLAIIGFLTFTSSEIIFYIPSDTLFWDSWAITKNDISSLLKPHNEHLVFLPQLIALLPTYIDLPPETFNLTLSAILRILSLLFIYRSTKSIALYLSKDKSIGIIFTLAVTASSAIFLISPYGFRNLGWSFQLGWYIPLFSSAVCAYFILQLLIPAPDSFENNKSKSCYLYPIFITQALTLLSGGQSIVIIFINMVFIFLSPSNLSKKTKLSFCFFSSLLILGYKFLILGHLESSYHFSIEFLLSVLSHSSAVSIGLLIISCIFIPIILKKAPITLKPKLDNHNKFLFSAFILSAYYICIALCFTLLVTLSRSGTIDADTHSPSYPTFTGLFPLGLSIFIIASLAYLIVKKTTDQRKTTFSFFLLNLVPLILFTCSYHSFSSKYEHLSTEREWQFISYSCRISAKLALINNVNMSQISFSENCGRTHPSDQVPLNYINCESKKTGAQYCKKLSEQFEGKDFKESEEIANTQLVYVYKTPIHKLLPFIKTSVFTEQPNHNQPKIKPDLIVGVNIKTGYISVISKD